MTVFRIAMIALAAHVSLTIIAEASDEPSVPVQPSPESTPDPTLPSAVAQPAPVKGTAVTPFLAALDIVGDPEEPLPLRWAAIDAISGVNLGSDDNRKMAFDRLLAVGKTSGSHPKLQHRVLEVYYHFLNKTADATEKDALSAKFIAACEHILASHEIDEDIQIAAIDWAIAIPKDAAETEHGKFISTIAGKLSDGRTNLQVRKKLLQVLGSSQ